MLNYQPSTANRCPQVLWSVRLQDLDLSHVRFHTDGMGFMAIAPALEDMVGEGGHCPSLLPIKCSEQRYYCRVRAHP